MKLKITIEQEVEVDEEVFKHLVVASEEKDLDRMDWLISLTSEAEFKIQVREKNKWVPVRIEEIDLDEE